MLVSLKEALREEEVFYVCLASALPLTRENSLIMNWMSVSGLSDLLTDKKKKSGYVKNLKDFDLELILSLDDLYSEVLAKLVAKELHLPLVMLYRRNEKTLEEWKEEIHFPQSRKVTLPYLLKKTYEYEPVKSIVCNKAIYVSGNKTVLAPSSVNTYLKEELEESIQSFSEDYLLKETDFRKDDTVLLTVANGRNQLEIRIRTDTYLEMRLRKEMSLSKEEIRSLLKEERFTLAVLGCLKKLTYKDQSKEEMRRYLKRNHALEEQEAESVIQYLERRGYLNDELYARNLLEALRSKQYGKKKILSELKKKKIDEEIIEKTLSAYSRQEEKENAAELAERLQKTIRKRTVKASKQALWEKLAMRGYSMEEIELAIQSLDYSNEAEEEKFLLAEKMNKAYQSLSQKYSGYELRNRLIKKMNSLGFSYEDIRNAIDEMEMEE